MTDRPLGPDGADLRPLARLAALGLRLPHTPAPVTPDVPALRVGTRVVTSGHLPLIDGSLPATGRVGDGITVPEAATLARVAAVNALAAVHGQVPLDDVVRVVRVVGYVASADGFTQQPAVVDGASHLLLHVFGERGRHVRSAVGVAWLPLGSPVAVELEVEVGPDTPALAHPPAGGASGASSTEGEAP
ncbi:RidA family protein [Cellulomonas dongxiuzhuiae]|uniref:RidA family protein n=1 Tax=Cellulomonas dongxiuzhuiae TaxID=2819979 RepID=A0ABX8GLM4_9CELL|nr:RidA family protein [Cellulomonas dongxiuzhuiae]MBO3096393.1 RidA family protein [Cellulomonas dongxiuzhuiae]QWC16802.1 RidA family protein [Cellulomonas dongxiuzhuiae]